MILTLLVIAVCAGVLYGAWLMWVGWTGSYESYGENLVAFMIGAMFMCVGVGGLTAAVRFQ